MQIVTLTTDWGLSDYYVGVVKGRLHSMIDDLTIVDITHEIDDYNLLKTSFIVKNACFQYPEGTIHIIDVNSYEQAATETSKTKSYIVVKHKEQYYICTDNGLPSAIFEDDEVEITDINLYNETDYYTFSALDLFPKVVKMIANNHSIDNIGNRLDSFFNKITKKQYIEYPNSNSILLHVIYVDKYGNVFLNIKDYEFKQVRNNRSFSIKIAKFTIDSISLSYADVRIGEPLLTISSSGYLQLALREANYSKLLGTTVGDPIQIFFN